MSTYWTIKCQTCNVDMRDDGIFWNHAGDGLHAFVRDDVPALRVLALTRPNIVIKLLPDWGYEYGIQVDWFLTHDETHDVVVFNEYGETFDQWIAKFK